MSIPDPLLELYVFSFVDIQQQEKDTFKALIHANPYLFKKALAHFISSIIAGEHGADIAENEFARKFSKNDFQESDFKSIQIDKANITDILVSHGILGSKTEVRRMVEA
jgi:tyrosyl-tRNA synthetase